MISEMGIARLERTIEAANSPRALCEMRDTLPCIGVGAVSPPPNALADRLMAEADGRGSASTRSPHE